MACIYFFINSGDLFSYSLKNNLNPFTLHWISTLTKKFTLLCLAGNQGKKRIYSTINTTKRVTLNCFPKNTRAYWDLFTSPLLQISQLQHELKKARKETDFERQRSLKNPTDTQKLKDELNAVRAKLLETETLFPVNKRLIFIAI